MITDAATFRAWLEENPQNLPEPQPQSRNVEISLMRGDWNLGQVTMFTEEVSALYTDEEAAISAINSFRERIGGSKSAYVEHHLNFVTSVFVNEGSQYKEFDFAPIARALIKPITAPKEKTRTASSFDDAAIRDFMDVDGTNKPVGTNSIRQVPAALLQLSAAAGDDQSFAYRV